MPLENIKRALLCKHCQECYILRADYFCNIDGCDCTEEKEFETILDLYAFLYRSLDNMNYTDYETLSWRDTDKVEHARVSLDRRWQSHNRHTKSAYRHKMYITLQEDTRAFFMDEIARCASLEDVLIFLVQFLQQLDQHLLHLKNNYMNFHRYELPIQSKYGLLIYKRDSELREALKGHPASRSFPDPNYLLLRRKVKHFFVARANYRYYEVRHQYVKTPDFSIENVLDLKLGLLPGMFHAGRDYIFKIDHTLTDEGLLPFYFAGVHHPEQYYSNVMELYRDMLKKQPHIIMLPELFTPPPLREALITEVRAALEATREASSPFFLLTGSFHEEQEGHIYNLAHVVASDGEVLLEVSKMNRFIFPRDEQYDDERSYFTKYDGVEKNAYDRRMITLFETSLGRIAFLICVDFINDNIQDILLDRQVDLVFIMAMTSRPGSGKFVRKMQELAERNACIVVLCNNLGSPDMSASRAVISLPGFKHVYQTDQAMLVVTLNEVIQEITKPST